MKFCSKCGKELSNDATICMGCGCAVESLPMAATEPPQKVELQKPTYKSLSMIFQAILAALGIVFLFLEGFVEMRCAIYYKIYGSYIYDSSYHFTDNFNFFTDVISVIIAIVLISAPLILSVLNYFWGSKTTVNLQKTLNWLTFGGASASLVYMIVRSLIGISSSEYTRSYTRYGIITQDRYTFSNFSVLFYIEIAILVLMVVIALLDAIGKPILKQKIKSQQ